MVHKKLASITQVDDGKTWYEEIDLCGYYIDSF